MLLEVWKQQLITDTDVANWLSGMPPFGQTLYHCIKNVSLPQFKVSRCPLTYNFFVSKPECLQFLQATGIWGEGT